MKRLSLSEGVGTLTTGGLILTCAHLFQHVVKIEIKPADAERKYAATIAYRDEQRDIAILKVTDERFFEGRSALPIAPELPKIGMTGEIYTFHDSRPEIVVQKAPITAIDFVKVTPTLEFLRLEIATEVVAGNSGGPLVIDGKMAGMVCSRHKPQKASLVSSAEIASCLAACKEGRKLPGFNLLDGLVTMEPGSTMHRWLGLESDQEGVVVSSPYSDAPEHALKKWDVITAVGGVAIDSDGFGETEFGLRVRIGYFVRLLAREGRVTCTIIRKGKVMDIEVPVFEQRPKVIPSLKDSRPPYFIFGPIAFTIATQEFLEAIERAEGGESLARKQLVERHDPLLTRRSDQPAFAAEQLVLVPCRPLDHPTAKDLPNAERRIVSTVNGQPVKNLRHLVEMLREATERILVIEFSGRYAEPLILDREVCMQATPEILRSAGVPAQGSPEMLAVWNAKGAPLEAQRAP